MRTERDESGTALAPAAPVTGARGVTVNDAATYGVRVVPTAAAEGESYWQVRHVRHLSPVENRGKHNVFVDVVDEHGQPLRDLALRIGWSWEGRRADERADPKPLDKPPGEPAGNVDMYKGQRLQVWIEGDGRPSERVENLHTNHPDESGPGGELWNSLGHHSFHVVFQRTRRAAPAPSTGAPAVATQPTAPPAVTPAPVTPPPVTPPDTPPIAQPTPPPGAAKPTYYPDYIYGLHEPGGEQLMVEAGRPGWVLALAEVGLDGQGAEADFSRLAEQRLGVIVRINHGYGSTGTLPRRQHYEQFARACARYVQRSRGCHIWIIGNEPNHEAECPSGQAILPVDYARAYTLCRTAIRAMPGHERDQVLVAGPAPWNATTTYPGNEKGDWVQYFTDTLAHLPDDSSDGFALHTYTHDLDPAQITGDFYQSAQDYQHLRNEFRSYIDFMQAIPPRFRHLPVFITETDPTDPHTGWRDGANTGWVRTAYEEIAAWNADPAHQPILALLLYRWPQLPDQPQWSIINRPGIVEDFRQALRLEPAERFRLRLPQVQSQPEQPASTPPPALIPLPRIYTNQQLIDAFYTTASALGAGDYRILLQKAGLHVDVLAQDRQGRYQGLAVEELPDLSAQERNTLQRELLVQLLGHVRWVGLVNAPAGLNLRAGAGTDAAILAQLPHETLVQVLGELDDWLFIAAGGMTGYVARAHVLARIAAPVAAPAIPARPTADETALAAPTDMRLSVPGGADATTQAVVRIWNRYGGLLAQEAARLQIDPGLAVAVLVAESSGEPFAPDGQLVIRFENHVFYQRWGQTNETRFRQHFSFDAQTPWQRHQWRPDAQGAWQACHVDQEGEWQVLQFARRLDEQAALASISMGLAQIMGFNHETAGYASPYEMFAAFQESASAQLRAFFRFIEGRGLVAALRNSDLTAFAEGYNGPGQKQTYAALIQRYLAAFTQVASGLPQGRHLRPAQPRLPVPTMPERAGAKPLREVDPELYAAWRNHIEQGFANNQTMFAQILGGFMNPYWTTVWMYRILFGLGVASFVAAVVVGLITRSEGFALIFGGLSAVTMLAYFFNRPLQALEENLQFITWLGIIYNTYWTRLAYISELATVQQELKAATVDTIAAIQEMMAKHVERSGQRPGLR